MTNKQIILERMKQSLEKFESCMGVQSQMNAALMYGIIENVEKNVSEEQATAAIAAIEAAEESQKAGAIKYGWPVQPVQPINYEQFISDHVSYQLDALSYY